MKEESGVCIAALALGLFALSHLGTGGWQVEYYVPAIMASFPVFGIVFSKAYGHPALAGPGRHLLEGMLATVLVWVVFSYNLNNMDLSSTEPPLSRAGRVGKFIREHTQPTDRVLAMDAFITSYVAGREVLPGLEMAAFSYQNYKTDRVKRLRLVNAEILMSYIANRAAGAVVLDRHDWLTFERSGAEKLIRAALEANYAQAFTMDNFGHGHIPVHVYLPKK